MTSDPFGESAVTPAAHGKLLDSRRPLWRRWRGWLGGPGRATLPGGSSRRMSSASP